MPAKKPANFLSSASEIICRGGLTTKIHMLCQVAGFPLKFIIITQGESNDMPLAIPLLRGFRPKYVVADRGYDSDFILDYIDSIGSNAVITPKSNRLIQREYDRYIYKKRNVIECLCPF